MIKKRKNFALPTLAMDFGKTENQSILEYFLKRISRLHNIKNYIIEIDSSNILAKNIREFKINKEINVTIDRIDKYLNLTN